MWLFAIPSQQSGIAKDLGEGDGAGVRGGCVVDGPDRSNRFSTDSGTHERKNGVYSRPGSPGPPGLKISEPIRSDCSLCRARMICNVISSPSGWAIVERSRELTATQVDLGCQIGRELVKLRIESGRAIAERYRGAAVDRPMVRMRPGRRRRPPRGQRAVRATAGI